MRLEDVAARDDASEGGSSLLSGDSSFCDEPDLQVLGVRVEDEGWVVAGVVSPTGEEFAAHVRAQPLPLLGSAGDGAVVLCTAGECFGISVAVSEALQGKDREVLELNNGEEFWDEDGDFDHTAAGMPVNVWRYIYGYIMAPVRLLDDMP
jgi:hypothetical protein